MQFEYTPADAAHFWSRVDCDGPIPAHRPEIGPCWIWTGSKLPSGYGTLTFRQVSYRATRFALVLTHGAIPEGMRALHHCDNPPCVRPSHLFMGTQKANMRDAQNKGRTGGFITDRTLGHHGESHHSARLTEDQVRAIRRRIASDGRRGQQRRLAREYGISETVLSKIVRGDLWKHVLDEPHQ
jgi:hypothetical protein